MIEKIKEVFDGKEVREIGNQSYVYFECFMLRHSGLESSEKERLLGGVKRRPVLSITWGDYYNELPLIGYFTWGRLEDRYANRLARKFKSFGISGRYSEFWGLDPQVVFEEDRETLMGMVAHLMTLLPNYKDKGITELLTEVSTDIGSIVPTLSYEFMEFKEMLWKEIDRFEQENPIAYPEIILPY